jgi:hypothetical protein
MRIEKAVTPPFFSSGFVMRSPAAWGRAITRKALRMVWDIETSCKTPLGFVCLLKMNIKINKN